MVSTVPPPVPPRAGLTPVMSAVFVASYVYPPARVLVTPFSVTATSQAKVPVTGAVEIKVNIQYICSSYILFLDLDTKAYSHIQGRYMHSFKK